MQRIVHDYSIFANEFQVTLVGFTAFPLKYTAFFVKPLDSKCLNYVPFTRIPLDCKPVYVCMRFFSFILIACDQYE